MLDILILFGIFVIFILVDWIVLKSLPKQVLVYVMSAHVIVFVILALLTYTGFIPGITELLAEK
ncbi:hypothetical protein [Staphylospora marina]|uniref:hypothetical protein n=1 Tax=Staphylospora marina TaxID=2490858 RepID=UPI000F5BDB4B|nr:hypothetical protein [Staphylospora marina]